MADRALYTYTANIGIKATSWAEADAIMNRLSLQLDKESHGDYLMLSFADVAVEPLGREGP